MTATTKTAKRIRRSTTPGCFIDCYPNTNEPSPNRGHDFNCPNNPHAEWQGEPAANKI